MKAKIIYENNLYYGQVYGTWFNPLFYLVDDDEFSEYWIGWNTVTIGCFTYLGAKYELQKWKRRHIPQDFEI